MADNKFQEYANDKIAGSIDEVIALIFAFSGAVSLGLLTEIEQILTTEYDVLGALLPASFFVSIAAILAMAAVNDYLSFKAFGALHWINQVLAAIGLGTVFAIQLPDIKAAVTSSLQLSVLVWALEMAVVLGFIFDLDFLVETLAPGDGEKGQLDMSKLASVGLIVMLLVGAVGAVFTVGAFGLSAGNIFYEDTNATVINGSGSAYQDSVNVSAGDWISQAEVEVGDTTGENITVEIGKPDGTVTIGNYATSINTTYTLNVSDIVREGGSYSILVNDEEDNNSVTIESVTLAGELNSPPTVENVNDLTGTVNTSTDISVNVSDPEGDNITSMEWDVDDDGTVEYTGSESITHTYDTTGTYNVSFTAVDEYGDTTTAEFQVSVVEDTADDGGAVSFFDGTWTLTEQVILAAIVFIIILVFIRAAVE